MTFQQFKQWFRYQLCEWFDHPLPNSCQQFKVSIHGFMPDEWSGLSWHCERCKREVHKGWYVKREPRASEAILRTVVHGVIVAMDALVEPAAAETPWDPTETIRLWRRKLAGALLPARKQTFQD